jgi:hypothetical protein
MVGKAFTWRAKLYRTDPYCISPVEAEQRKALEMGRTGWAKPLKSSASAMTYWKLLVKKKSCES